MASSNEELLEEQLPEQLAKQEPEQEDIEQIFADFWEETGPQEELVVDVYRRDEKGQLVYCSRFEAEGFNLEELRKRHGGGKYQCRARMPGSNKSRSRTVVLEGKPKLPKEDGKSDEERTLLEVVTDTQQGILETLAELRNPKLNAQANQSGADPVQLALSIMGAMQHVMAPYQEALLQKDREAPSFDKFIEAFREGMNFAQDLSPQGSGGYDQVIKSLGLPLLAQLQEQGRMERHTPRAQLPAPEENPPSSPQSPARPSWDVMLGPYVSTLQEWARRNKNAELRAALVSDELPAELEELLVVQLERGTDFLVEFFTLHPECRQFEPWYRLFWGNLAAIYLSEEEADQEVDDTPGDTEEPPPNG